jgi:hypothetical protein
MKKIIFSVILAGAVMTVSAQEITMYRVHNPNNASAAYTTSTTYMVPQHINAVFIAEHPGVTVIEWQPVNNQTWWRAAYHQNNRLTYVFYNDAGMTHTVALPVLHNFVPEDVIATALEQYGPAVYGVSTMKDANGQVIYQVHLIENGVSRMAWIDARGTEVTKVFRDRDMDDDDDDDDTVMNQ